MINSQLKGIVCVDFWKEVSKRDNFVGFPFEVEYDRVNIFVNDFEKEKVGGIPKGCFLICVNTAVESIDEVHLLRVLNPVKLPSHNDVLAARVEYYKEFLPKNTREFDGKLDAYTRNEFQCSGLECRVLGTYYRYNDGVRFGADVENYLSSHNYLAFKPTGDLLKFIINYNGENTMIGGKNHSKLGMIKYSSVAVKDRELDVPVYINPHDLLKNRTACFGMTRTGKSNTVKKLIECTIDLSKAENRKVGQLIFDINGEYANPNKQDEGTAIYEKYISNVSRYSIIDKPGFQPMRANFYKEPEFALQVILPFLTDESSDYIKNFNTIDLTYPDKDDPDAYSIKARVNRRRAALFCCLKKADFREPVNFKVNFTADKELVAEISTALGKEINPEGGMSISQATVWFEKLWEIYSKSDFIKNYKLKKDREWADDDLKTLLRMLTLKKENGSNDNISGYRKLKRKELAGMHTEKATSHFETDILRCLRDGKIVIVDLSEGEEITRNTYSERIVTTIFHDSMKRFIDNQEEKDGFNIIQLYFEEAHNLFPKKDNSDLSQIYNRLAKEGAKLNLGINYATQEVSSISSNILKNTQNWFVAHLNNKDEIKELVKFYDFEDFSESILRVKDKGYIRMKSHSNDFVIPVQIDKFKA